MHRVLVLVLVLLAAACRGRPTEGAPCAAIATRRLTLARTALGSATIAPPTQRLLAEQLAAMRDALTRACSEGGWSAAVRDCMVQATDHAAFQACELRLTSDQRLALDRAAHGETPSP